MHTFFKIYFKDKLEEHSESLTLIFQRSKVPVESGKSPKCNHVFLGPLSIFHGNVIKVRSYFEQQSHRQTNGGHKQTAGCPVA